MYKLFQDVGRKTGRLFLAPDTRRVKEGLELSLNTVISYRRRNPVALNHDHVLVKVLDSINVGYHDDPGIYVAKVQDRTLNLAQTFNFCSMLSPGRMNDVSPFYGQGIQDIIYATDEDFDTDQAVKDWQNLESIRVLTHPLTDLWLNPPDGLTPNQGKGIAVVVVNIPMLALQFQLWKKQARSQSTESLRPTSQFLQEIPLANMLRSHLDVAIANRMFAWLSPEPLPKTRNRHPFHLVDWERDMDRLIDRYMDYLTSRKCTFEELLSHIPTVSSISLQQTYRLPPLHYVQQVQWAVLLARLPAVGFCLQMTSLYGLGSNRNEIVYIQRYLKEFHQARLLQNSMNPSNVAKFQELIEYQVKPFI